MKNYMKLSLVCFTIITYYIYSMLLLPIEVTIGILFIAGAYLIYLFKITDKIKYLLIPISVIFNFAVVILFIMGLFNIYNPYKQYDIIKAAYGSNAEQENYFKLHKLFTAFNSKYENKIESIGKAVNNLEVNEKTINLCLESKKERENIFMFIRNNKIAFPEKLDYKKANYKYLTLTKISKLFYLEMIEIKIENNKDDSRYLKLWESIKMITDAKLNIINEKYMYLIIQKNIEFTIERKEKILEKDREKIEETAEHIYNELNNSIKSSFEYQFDYQKNTILQIAELGVDSNEIKDNSEKEERMNVKKFSWPFIIKDETIFRFSEYHREALKNTDMNLSEVLKLKERYREEDKKFKENIPQNIGIRNIAGKIIFHVAEYGQYVKDLEKKEQLKINLKKFKSELKNGE